jgi:soluble lytic murein transglycosylase-like protein
VIRLYSAESVVELPAVAVIGFEEFAEPAPEPVLAVQTRIVETPPSPVKLSDPRSMVREAALRAGLPPAFVESVAMVESAFQPGAISSKGASGIMQLMPDTAKSLGADPHDLEQSSEAGTRLQRDLLINYDGDVVKALSAYNAGEGAVARYQGLPPYTETRLYVNKVIGAYLDAKSK